MIPKAINQTSFPNHKIYTLEQEIINLRDHLVYVVLILKYDLLYNRSFIILFGNMLFPTMTAECAHISLQNYPNSRQNIIIMIWKYLVDIRCEAWLNFLGIHKWKIVCSAHSLFIHPLIQDPRIKLYTHSKALF
jgi:hypothetical protein